MYTADQLTQLVKMSSWKLSLSRLLKIQSYAATSTATMSCGTPFNQPIAVVTLDNELTILNDGKNHTRNNPQIGNESVPDITCCGSAWKGKAEWRVRESIGSSDHLPIIITLNTKVNH